MSIDFDAPIPEGRVALEDEIMRVGERIQDVNGARGRLIRYGVPAADRPALTEAEQAQLDALDAELSALQTRHRAIQTRLKQLGESRTGGPLDIHPIHDPVYDAAQADARRLRG